jgi:hypothetical protein
MEKVVANPSGAKRKGHEETRTVKHARPDVQLTIPEVFLNFIWRV